MNFVECLKRLIELNDDSLWMRPKMWTGWQQALCLSYDRRDVELVPLSSGGRAWNTSDIQALLDTWEIIEADKVNNGK